MSKHGLELGSAKLKAVRGIPLTHRSPAYLAPWTGFVKNWVGREGKRQSSGKLGSLACSG